jgi:hypothetical protein
MLPLACGRPAQARRGDEAQPRREAISPDQASPPSAIVDPYAALVSHAILVGASHPMARAPPG